MAEIEDIALNLCRFYYLFILLITIVASLRPVSPDNHKTHDVF